MLQIIEKKKIIIMELGKIYEQALEKWNSDDYSHKKRPSVQRRSGKCILNDKKRK